MAKGLTMVDKNILNIDLGGFEAADSETFALENLTAYPGDSVGFVIPQPEKIEQEVIVEEVHTKAAEELLEQTLPAEETFQVDEDLLRSLKEDLSKSKKAKGDFQDNIEPFQQQDFVEFDNDPNTETINLDDIKAVHPSAYNVQEEHDVHEEVLEPLPSSEGYGGYGGYAALAQELSSEPDSVPPVVDEKPQKKKRKPITLPSLSKRTVLIAASIAGVAIVGASAYFLAPTVSGLFASHEADSSHVSDANHKEASHDKGHEKNSADPHHSTEEHHVDDKAITKIPDSLLNEIADDTKHTDNTTHDEHGSSHAETHEKVKSEDHHTSDKKENSVHAQTEEHPAEKHSEKKHSSKHTDAHAEVNNNHSNSSSKSQDVHHSKKKTEHSQEHGKTSHKSEVKDDAKDTHHAEATQHKKHSEEKVAESKVKEEGAKQEQITSASKEVKPLFTIQVYATPSKNEAERWLNKLRSVSAQSPVITTQSIRDKTWYRVRFGNFTSRDDAEKAVRNLGYDQCWIDRVR